MQRHAYIMRRERCALYYARYRLASMKDDTISSASLSSPDMRTYVLFMLAATGEKVAVLLDTRSFPSPARRQPSVFDVFASPPAVARVWR